MRTSRVRCLSILVLLSFVSFGSTASSQDRSKASWSFQSHVSSEYSTLLVVNDPLPHIERLMHSGAMEQVFEILQQMAPSGPNAITDPNQVLNALQQNKSFVPTETVIGLSPTSYVQGTRFCRICLLTGLYASSSPEETTSTLNEVRKELLADLKRFKLPNLVVYAEFRDEVIPSQAMAVVPMLAQQLGNQLQSTQTKDGVSYRLQLSVGEVFPQPALVGVMQNLGYFTGKKASDVQAFANVLSQLSCDIKFDRLGNSLRLTIQPSSRPLQPITKEDLGKLWNGANETIYFGKWDITPLKRPWLALCADWKRWKSTPAANRLVTLDDEDLLLDLELSEASLQRTSPKGAMLTTSGEVLKFTMHEEGFSATPSLVDFPVVELFPKDSNVMVSDATITLADFVANHLAKVEDRLSLRSLGTGDRARNAENTLQAYYGRLKDFREFVFEDSRELFVPPIGIVGRVGGNLEELSIAFDLVPDVPFSFSIKDREISEYALIGRLNPETRGGDQYYQQLYKYILAGFEDAVSSSGTLVEQKDLGIGLPTYVFTHDAIDLAMPSAELVMKGDFELHYFVLDKWLVLSTSPKLSQTMVQLSKKDKKEVKVPRIANKKVVGVGMVDRDAITQFMKDMGILLELAFELRDFGNPSATSARASKNTIEGLAKLGNLVKQVRWFSTETPDLRESKYRLEFAD